MPELDLAIRGGRICTAAESFIADLGVREGRIAAIGERLTGAAREVDATGLWVLPGGVDAHVHCAQPSGEGVEMADDFLSVTRAAAAGGTTTILPFALQQRGQSLREAVSDYHRQAEGKMVIDTSFHLIVTDPTPQVLGQELPALVRDGYTSFKVFMTYDELMLRDADLLAVMDVARRERALVMVHAEGHDAIRFLTDRLEAAGDTAPYFHALSRPQIAEREATHRAISHAELVGVPIVIVHVSGPQATEQIRWARARGLSVLAETCPQYLTLTAEDLRRQGLDGDPFEGAKFVCSPPPRDTAAQAAVWAGIEDGTFDLFSSDHCAFRYADSRGKDRPGARSAFRWVPNGIPGVQTRLAILFSEGVSKGRIPVERFVALTATNPARVYGLHPRKGSLGIGADADITLWDPSLRATIRQAGMHHGTDYTPWEGFEVTGWPVQTWARGRLVAEQGRVTGDPGEGRHVPRAVSPWCIGQEDRS